MSAHIQQASLLSGRQFAMVVVVALHAAVISALLAMKVIPEIASAVPRLIVEVQPRPEKVPDVMPESLPLPATAGPPVERIPIPLVPIAEADVEPPLVGIDPPPAGAGAGAGDAPAAAPRYEPLGYRVVRGADEFFPPQSRILAEQGVAIVRVCVGADGQLQGAPAVERGSGSRRLDAAAVSWAREALVFTPARRDGVPEPACRSFRVVFQLR